MFKELINTLSFMYCFTARSRGKLGQQELDGLRSSAQTMSNFAPAVLSEEGHQLTEDERRDLEEAEMIDSHIEEMVSWLISLEIV